MHLLHLLSSKYAQTPVGDQLPYFVEFYFLLKIIGIDHVVEFVGCVIRLIYPAKLQFYDD